MPILAIETSTLVSSLALATADKLLAEITIQTRKTHSEQLMPHVAQIMDMAQVDKKQLKAVAISNGPGSFTGLRIGLATAKALAYALQIPLIGVPTMAALAYNCALPGVMLAPMLDAQKNNVYQGLYTWEQGALKEIMPPTVLHLEESLALFSRQIMPVLAMGEAAVLYREALEGAGAPVLVAPPHLVIQRAATTAALAHERLREGTVDDVMNLEPVYIRRAEAEVLWERRQGAKV